MCLLQIDVKDNIITMPLSYVIMLYVIRLQSIFMNNFRIFLDVFWANAQFVGYGIVLFTELCVLY